MTLISCGNRDAGFENGFHGAGSGRVVVAEDCVGAGLERKQASSCKISAGIIGGMHDVGIRHFDSRGGEGVLIALLAARRRS